MITARNLTKKFGGITALLDLTLSIGPGEFLFLTGPSGSGKTTLLRLALRDLVPDSGSLVVNNHDLGKLKKARPSPQESEAVANEFKKMGYEIIKSPVLGEKAGNVEYLMRVVY